MFTGCVEYLYMASLDLSLSSVVCDWLWTVVTEWGSLSNVWCGLHSLYIIWYSSVHCVYTHLQSHGNYDQQVICGCMKSAFILVTLADMKLSLLLEFDTILQDLLVHNTSEQAFISTSYNSDPYKLQFRSLQDFVSLQQCLFLQYPKGCVCLCIL